MAEEDVASKSFQRPAVSGALASLLLLIVYLAVVGTVSDFDFARKQLANYWPYILALAAGFGVQVALYMRLKLLHCKHRPTGALITSGSTATLSMLACCLHYLAIFIPLIGMLGLVSFVDRYQAQLFWIALIFNGAGILYMLKMHNKLRHHYE